MFSDTNLVRFALRRTGASLLFCVEPAGHGRQTFDMRGIPGQRLQYERDALQALEAGGVGSWSYFPREGIEATVTRDQLWRMSFRGN